MENERCLCDPTCPTQEELAAMYPSKKINMPKIEEEMAHRKVRLKIQEQLDQVESEQRSCQRIKCYSNIIVEETSFKLVLLDADHARLTATLKVSDSNNQ